MSATARPGRPKRAAGFFLAPRFRIRAASPLRHNAGMEPPARRATDALLLAAALAVPLLGAAMRYDPAGRVWFTGFESAPLPTLCPSRWLGFRCPTCGVTRSVIALMHGDWRASLALHRF